MNTRICFLFAILATFVTMSCVNARSESNFGYNEFFKKATFLPSAFLSELSKEDKTWFSDNIFNLQWSITDRVELIEASNVTTLSQDQQRYVKDRIFSMLKIFNYTVNTKSFAAKMENLDTSSYTVGSSNGSPNSLPIVLALRGLNSESFNTGELKVVLTSDLEDNSGVTDENAVLDSSTDEVFSSILVDSAAWDFWGNKDINLSIIRLGVNPKLFKRQTTDELYQCSLNESEDDGVFTYRQFVRALLQTIFDWKDIEGADNLLLDAVADVVTDVTCVDLVATGIDSEKDPPFKDVNFSNLRFLRFIQ